MNPLKEKERKKEESKLTTPSPSSLGVCQRRQWPEPHYEPYRTRTGWHCKVRVNNREYSTEVPYASENLARDGAAQKGYMICRNFSVNDGMGPGQRPGSSVQGLPVAIGTGRRGGGGGSGGGSGGKRGSAASYDTISSGGTAMTTTTDDDGTLSSSGGNSPRSVDSGFEVQMRLVTQQCPKPLVRQLGGGGGGGRRSKASLNHNNNIMVKNNGNGCANNNNHHHHHHHHDSYVCYCQRGTVRAYGRCGWCLSEAGWQ